VNYQFSLQVRGDERDVTNLDTNEPDHALYLFLDEFGWRKKLSPEELEETAVVLVSVEPDQKGDNDE